MSVEDAINHYQEKYEDGDLILITGSLYFVSEARAEILNYDYRV